MSRPPPSQLADVSSAPKLDPIVGSKLISSIQQVSDPNLLKIPSTHMAPDSLQYVQDPTVLPTYIPPTDMADSNYIQNAATQPNPTEVIKNTNTSVNYSSADLMYEEIQTPALLAILFFLFQLPVFKKTNYAYLRFLFSDDGQYNIKGHLFTSVIFSITYYSITLIIDKFIQI